MQQPSGTAKQFCDDGTTAYGLGMPFLNDTHNSTRARQRSHIRKRVNLAVRSIARRLPPPRDEALVRMIGNARVLIFGRAAAQSAQRPAPRKSVHSVTTDSPQSPPVPRPPIKETDIAWRTPPKAEDPGRAIRSVYRAGAAPPRYDLELLERLNAEYAHRPIVPQPPDYASDSLTIAARRRVLWVHNMVNLADKRVLEIGCGNGYELWHAAEHLGADAYGVDVTEYGPWRALSGERVHFECVDLTVRNPYPPDFFDRIMSFTVWEHVLHPYRMLEEAYRVLKPRGLAWIRANLYAGPQASHRYRDFHFPWPHLLFSDDVIKAWDRKHGKPERGSAWVNRLSWLHYQHYFDRIGFRVRHLHFDECQFDEEFYSRFEDILGRYPRFDLTKDYFLVVLEKT
jgi:SAM-dependent methyltransferase